MFRAQLLTFVVLLIPCVGVAQFGQYSDVTAARGISVPPYSQANGVGRGASWADFDGDGDMDVFTVGGASNPFVLHRNDGTNSFVPTTVFTPPTPLIQNGVVAADFDNDGDKDVYVTIGQGGANLLFVNNGAGGFNEEAATRGVALTAGTNDSYAATWGDFDRDGWLDLYVGDYGSTMPSSKNSLFHNDGTGNFTDIGASAGVDQLGQSLAALWHDFNYDQWPDLYVANDRGATLLQPNRMFINQRWNLNFLDEAPTLNTNAFIDAMGITVGDIENDGDWDMYVSDLGSAVLMVYDGTTNAFNVPVAGDFSALATNYGINTNQFGWAPQFFDYNHDGWLDLLVMNQDPPNRLFIGTGAGSFTDASVASQLSTLVPPYFSAVCVDYDGDGDLDLYTPGGIYNAQLLEAPGDEFRAWLKIRPTGTLSNRDAKGLIAIVRTSTHTQRRMLTSGEGFLSDASEELHFGLDFDFTAQEVELRWPSGQVNYLTSVPAMQTLTPVEPQFTFTGPLTPGSTNTVTFNAPEDAGKVFVCGYSISPFGEYYFPDGRALRVPVNDPAFMATSTSGNPWLVGSFGVMSPTGATMILPVPNIPTLTGFPFYLAGVTIDPLMPGYVRTIHGPQKWVVQ